jgi:hypothetical protein
MVYTCLYHLIMVIRRMVYYVLTTLLVYKQYGYYSIGIGYIGYIHCGSLVTSYLICLKDGIV